MATESGSTKYQTRLPADDAESVEEMRERKDLNKSEAIRELIQIGIKNEPVGQIESKTIQWIRNSTIATPALWVYGGLLFVVAYSWDLPLLSQLGGAVTLAVLAIVVTNVLLTIGVLTGFVSWLDALADRIHSH